MSEPGRKLVTFFADDAMLRDLTIAATTTNRTLGEEIETRLMALRLIEESMRILKGREARNGGAKIGQDQSLTGT